MRIKLIFLTLLFLFFGVRPAFAVSFTISNPQYNGNEITLDVSLSGLTSSSCLNGSCYIQAALTYPSPIKYFGFTKNNNGQWYEYISSPTISYIQSTFFNFQPVSGAWSGQLTLKINAESPNYHGPGTYNIKAWRYSGNSTSASGNSNVVTVDIQSSTPTPAPTPLPSQTSSNSTQSTSTTSSSSFTISNIPSEINSDQSFSVNVNLTLQDKPTTSFYLKGAFRHPDKPSNYFGLTKVGSSWIKNSNSSSDQFPITTNSSGNWSGNLEVQPDTNDSGFIGSGDYLFKVARYENNNLTWSNEVTIKIISVETSEQGGTSTETSTTSNPSATPSIPSGSKSIISTKSKSYDRLVYHNASVAAATASSAPSASPSSEELVKSQKQINFPLIIGLLLIVSGIGLSSYIYLQNHEKIFNKFRKRN